MTGLEMSGGRVEQTPYTAVGHSGGGRPDIETTGHFPPVERGVTCLSL